MALGGLNALNEVEKQFSVLQGWLCRVKHLTVRYYFGILN